MISVKVFFERTIDGVLEESSETFSQGVVIDGVNMISVATGAVEARLCENAAGEMLSWSGWDRMFIMANPDASG